ncbi:MAG: hypothetical protein PHT19_04750 [Methylococcus sp.]|nr:hypothetical protein [Methylococcus sp.]
MTEATDDPKPARSLKEALQDTVDTLKGGEKITVSKRIVIVAAVIALGLLVL